VKGIYYGWWIVAVALVTNMLFNGVTYSAFTMFVLPVSKAFHLSRADANTGMVLLSLGQAVTAPFLGRLIDFVSPKKALLAAAVLLGGSLAGLGLSPSPLVSAAICALPLPVAMLCGPFITLPLLINRWFTHQRGRAMALAVLGTSMGSLLVVPAVGLLIERFGWRACLLLLGGVLTVVLLALALLVRDRPGPGERETGDAAAGDVNPHAPAAAAPMALGEVVRRADFWTLTLGIAAATTMATTMLISFAPLAAQEGLSPMTAASLVSAMGLGAIIAKIGLAAVADRIDRVLLLAVVVALGALGNGALLLGSGYAVLAPCALFIGASMGVVGPLGWAILGDRFGPASFGTVNGLMSPAVTLLSATGHRFAGEVFDRTGSYAPLFVTFAITELVAAGLILATRYVRPSTVAVPAE
jgi:MFS family permease